MQMFPQGGIERADIDEFNTQARFEIETIRDFIILHYCVTNRQDTPFWRYCRNMEIPETLAHRIELFRKTGRVFRLQNELFAENSWLQVMLGQGITPEHYHPVVDVMDDKELDKFLKQIKGQVDATLSRLPDHAAYVEDYCRSVA